MSRTKQEIPLDRPMSNDEWQEYQLEEQWWERMEIFEEMRKARGEDEQE